MSKRFVHPLVETAGVLLAVESFYGCSASTGSGPTTGATTTASSTGTGPTTSGSTGSTSSAGGAGGSGGGATGGASTAGTGGSGGTAGAGGRGAGGTSAGGAGTGGTGPGGPDAGASCSATADPLRTNRTGTATADAYDCLLISLAQQFGHPDPMMIKSQVQQESSWNVLATSGDSPCGVPAGWTDPEAKSFGLIQVTPACGEARSALLPNGHPNMTTDMQAALWATSVYNPTLNLSEGYTTITASLRAVERTFAGCTQAEYVLMSAAAFNSGNNAVLGCNMYNARAQTYVTAVLGHYRTFAVSAGWPNPY